MTGTSFRLLTGYTIEKNSLMFVRIVPEVIKKYELDVRTVGAPLKGYRSESFPLELHDGTVVNLLFYKREQNILSRIRTADKVASAAAGANLPVRVRYDERLLRVGSGYAAVYQWLPGKTIEWEAYTKRHIKLAGWAMADLHSAVAALQNDGPLLADELQPLLARMHRYFSMLDVKKALAEKLGLSIEPKQFDHLEALIEKTRHISGQQYLHMDMVRGNMLFDGVSSTSRWAIDDVQLSGLIDFEKAAWGLPVCDMARTLAFLLVDCPKPARKIFKYFIDSGYKKRGARTLEHSELLPYFIRLFLLHDFYKFLKHTPYESLDDNYHYARTRELLKTYGMISGVKREGDPSGLEKTLDRAK